MSSKHEANYLENNNMDRYMSDHKDRMEQTDPFAAMERKDTRTPREVLESAEEVKARLENTERKSTFNWEAGRELAAEIRKEWEHSEVEGLVPDPSWRVRLKALSSVNIDREGGIYLRSIKDIYDLIEDALTTHSAKEYGKGFEDGLAAAHGIFSDRRN